MLDFAEVSPASWEVIELILNDPALLTQCLDAFSTGDATASETHTGQVTEHTVRDFVTAVADATSQVTREPIDLPLVPWQFVVDAIEPVLSALCSTDEIRHWTDAAEEASAG